MIKLFNINKKYGNKSVLKNLTYNFDKKGKIYTVIGKSGCGKTTLFNILFGLDPDFEGYFCLKEENTANFDDKKWDDVRKNVIHIVYQDFKLLETLTVLENLAVVDGDLRKSKIHCFKYRNILKQFNLDDCCNQKVSSLSGGQKQRLAIARAIVNKPEILLLDEPTGNLDNDHTNEFMGYINKICSDIIVIIITHDNRIIPNSDIVLKLENGKLTEDIHRKLEKTAQVDKNNMSVSGPINFHNHPFIYVKRSIKSKLLDILILNFPISIIFMIAIIVFSFISINVNDKFSMFFSGLSEEAIVLNTNQYSKNYINEKSKLGYSLNDDGTRIAFSNNDLENVKNIKGVKNAFLFDSTIISLTDKDQNKLIYSLDKNEYAEEMKKEASYSSAPPEITFTFNSNSVPYELVKYYNEKNIKLVSGYFPKDNSNEVLVPEIIVYKFFDISITECIGKDIDLSVIDENSKKITKTYKIAGIYDSEFSKLVKDNYPIYVSYKDPSNLNEMLTEDMYKRYKLIDFDSNSAVENYYNPIYESFDSYKEAIGTNLTEMIIIMGDVDNASYITSELNSLFPNLLPMSQFELETGEYEQTYKNINLFVYFSYFIFVILLGVIIVFINKGVIKQMNKELAILYSLGYSKFNIYNIVALQYCFTIVSDVIFAYTVLYISFIVYFKKTQSFTLFTNIFKFENIGSMILLFVIMNMLSIFVSLKGVNKKRLKRNLE